MDALAIPKAAFRQRISSGQMTPTAPVTVSFKLVHGVPVFKAGLGKGDIAMMMDTGAYRSLIPARLAVEKKVPMLRAEDATVELRGIMGNEAGRIGLLDPLMLGNWPLRGYACLVRTYENRLSNGRGASSFPGCLLGFDVALNHCRYLTLDYPAGQMTFGFGASFSPARVPVVASHAFAIRSGVPFVTLRSGWKTWEAIVDSGSFNGIEISETVAASLGVQDQGDKVKGLYLMSVGGSISSAQANLRTVTLPELTLLGDTYRQVRVDIAPGPPRVGSQFLKDYRVTFDFHRKRLWLER